MVSVYSLSSRLNNICFFAIVVLGVMAGANFLTGYLTHKEADIKFKLKTFHHFVNDKYYEAEDALISFDLDADLRKLFDWNTHMLFVWISVEFTNIRSSRNQITIWDKRILRSKPEKHVIHLANKTAEYSITDTYRRLSGQKAKVYFNYEHMPIVGINYKERVEIGEIEIPKNYFGLKRNEYY